MPKMNLYKGVSAQMIVSFPCAGAYFLGYEGTKHFLQHTQLTVR